MDVLAPSEKVNVSKWHFAEIVMIADPGILVLLAAESADAAGVFACKSESSDTCKKVDEREFGTFFTVSLFKSK